MEEIVGTELLIDTAEPAYLGFKSVLVVDDSLAARQAIVRLLRQSRLTRIHEASQAGEAFSILHKTPVDLVISDIVMPGVDGVKLASAIRATPALSHVAVMLVTGVRKPELVQASHKAGVDGFLLKPFSADQLQMMLNTVAGRHRARIGEAGR